MAEEIVKRGRGGKYNFPSAVDPETESPDVVREAATSVQYWYKRGANKATSDEEVQQRIDEFFSTCIETGQRMTVEKMALALGITRKTLYDWEIQSNKRGDIIKRAKEYLAAFDADLATSGRMNPVPYIFRAKNYYGMRDQVDIIAASGPGLAAGSAEEIAAKYEELPPD